MVTQHRTRAHVDDHQQPDAFNFEFLFVAKRIANHDLQTDIETVAIEFDDLVWAHSAAVRSGGHPLQMPGAGGVRRIAEVGKDLRSHVG